MLLSIDIKLDEMKSKPGAVDLLTESFHVKVSSIKKV